MTAKPPPPKVRCTALRADGQPCRAWALRPRPGQPPPSRPRCAAHRHRHDAPSAEAAAIQPIILNAPSPDALYDAGFSDDEFNAIEALAAPDLPKSEIRGVRVLLRRLFLDPRFDEEMTGYEMEQRALAFFKGAELVAHLLQAQRDLQDGGDALHPAISAALDDIGEELGIKL